MLTQLEINIPENSFEFSFDSKNEIINEENTRIVRAAEEIVQNHSMEQLQKRLACNMETHNFTPSVMGWLSKPSPFHSKK